MRILPKAGRITKIARENDIAVYYTYDDIDRLVAELWRKISDGSQIYGFWYDYDAANNRGQMRREAGAGVETESAYFWYNNADALTERVVFTPPSTEVATYYYYNLNGEREVMVEGGSPTYFGYGAKKMITAIAAPGETPTYFYYDGQLNRYCIDLAGTPTYYVWDGLRPLEERNADGSLKARYTHGHARNPDIGTVVEVERVAGGATYFQYLHMDHRGTVYKVTDAAENTQLEYTLDSFGRELSAPAGADPTVPNDLIVQTNGLTLTIGGKRYLVLKYRLIPLDEAAFPSRDFLPFINPYRAWGNNPVGQVDRDGRESEQTDVVTSVVDRLLQRGQRKDAPVESSDIKEGEVFEGEFTDPDTEATQKTTIIKEKDGLFYKYDATSGRGKGKGVRAENVAVTTPRKSIESNRKRVERLKKLPVIILYRKCEEKPKSFKDRVKGILGGVQRAITGAVSEAKAFLAKTDIGRATIAAQEGMKVAERARSKEGRAMVTSKKRLAEEMIQLETKKMKAIIGFGEKAVSIGFDVAAPFKGHKVLGKAIGNFNELLSQIENIKTVMRQVKNALGGKVDDSGQVIIVVVDGDGKVRTRAIAKRVYEKYWRVTRP